MEKFLIHEAYQPYLPSLSVIICPAMEVHVVIPTLDERNGIIFPSRGDRPADTETDPLTRVPCLFQEGKGRLETMPRFKLDVLMCESISLSELVL